MTWMLYTRIGGKLAVFRTNDCNLHWQAIRGLQKHLDSPEQKHANPILCLIKGGKS